MKAVLVALLASLRAAFRRRAALQLEVLALRHQLAVYQRRHPRAHPKVTDRLLWAWLSRMWAGWWDVLVFIQLPKGKVLEDQIPTPLQGRAKRAQQGDNDGPHGRPAWSVSQVAVKSGDPFLAKDTLVPNPVPGRFSVGGLCLAR